MRLAAIVIGALLVPSAGIGIAFGAGSDERYTGLRTETSAWTEVLPGVTAAVLAECEAGERATSGGFRVAGRHDGVDVLSSRRVVVAPRIGGWLVTVANGPPRTSS